MQLTVFLVCDGDQRLFLLPYGGSVGRFALGGSQDQTELLVLLVDGVVHQLHHARLLTLSWRRKR